VTNCRESFLWFARRAQRERRRGTRARESVEGRKGHLFGDRPENTLRGGRGGEHRFPEEKGSGVTISRVGSRGECAEEREETIYTFSGAKKRNCLKEEGEEGPLEKGPRKAKRENPLSFVKKDTRGRKGNFGYWGENTGKARARARKKKRLADERD